MLEFVGKIRVSTSLSGRIFLALSEAEGLALFVSEVSSLSEVEVKWGDRSLSGAEGPVDFT
ncbi:MAG: hypothetical protein IPG01_12200 [Chitinophagaceae bacterium]|nr:hypothetical protein [Chitinophagaceae bacterium]